MEGKDVCELANGEPVGYGYGFARVTIPRGTEPILGVVALENADIAVDPVRRAPKQMTARSLR